MVAVVVAFLLREAPRVLGEQRVADRRDRLAHRADQVRLEVGHRERQPEPGEVHREHLGRGVPVDRIRELEAELANRDVGHRSISPAPGTRVGIAA